MKRLIILLFLFPYASIAAEWSATQGNMIAIQTSSTMPIQTVSCFGKQWPVKKISDNIVKAWIGVDLKQKSGTYPIVWKAQNTIIRDTLKVKKGKFRISRISVTKSMSNFDSKAIQRIRADQHAIAKTYDIRLPMFPDFDHAVMPVQGIESTPFGAQRYVNGQPRSPHAGIDIAAPIGTPVLAPLAGKVLLVEDMFLNGTLIAIGHGQGLVSVYAHLSKSLVHVGEQVKTGQVFAKVGSTGRSTGAHLHWGLRFNHARINPNSLVLLASPQ